MQQKPQKIIKLANRSRKNRMFFDNLILELAICLNVGDTTLNRDLMLPSYRGIQTRCNDKEAISLSKVAAVGFNTPRQMLPTPTLDAIDRALREAPPQLKGCGSIRLIKNYISAFTDLNDCHLTALNTMQSIT